MPKRNATTPLKKSLQRVSKRNRTWRNASTDERSITETRNRLQTIISSFVRGCGDLSDVDTRFALLRGLPSVNESDSLSRSLDERLHVLDSLGTARDGPLIALTIGAWLQALEECDIEHTDHLDDIRSILSAAPAVNLRLVKHRNGSDIYPAGARLLDDAVVDDVLDWLQNHPSSAKHFRAALSLYQSGKSEAQRNLLDELRFALEQLLRAVLGNKKSLENQKQYLMPWLSKRGLHRHLSKMFVTLLDYHHQYQNQAVKHHEEYGAQEIEFLIYLTGTFMRTILQLNEDAD